MGSLHALGGDIMLTMHRCSRGGISESREHGAEADKIADRWYHDIPVGDRNAIVYQRLGEGGESGELQSADQETETWRQNLTFIWPCDTRSLHSAIVYRSLDDAVVVGTIHRPKHL